MNEDLFSADYNITKKNKLLRFYESNKILIFSGIFVLIIASVSIFFYMSSKENKKILLADNYMQAKIYLEKGEKNKARNILEKIIFSKNSTYSVLSLFLLLEENLIIDKDQLSKLFEEVLKNNKYDDEIENLIVLKRLIFESNFLTEAEILNLANPLIKQETIWKPHALMLLGDYFVFKNQNIKAREFYSKILLIKNLHQGLYQQAQSQLTLIAND